MVKIENRNKKKERDGDTKERNQIKKYKKL